MKRRSNRLPLSLGFNTRGAVMTVTFAGREIEISRRV